MAKKKQTKVEEVVPSFDTTTIRQERFEECEWCFQFDDDEPQIFAWTDEDIDTEENPKINFTISNTKEAHITFSSADGKTFRLFPREITDAGKEMRDKSKLKTNE